MAAFARREGLARAGDSRGRRPGRDDGREAPRRGSLGQAERSGHAVAGLSTAELPRGDFEIDLVPLGDALGVAPRIPNGTVLLVVREDRPNRPSRITHMGLVVVRSDGTRVVRHASDVPGVLRVRDEALEAFLRRAGRQKWKVVGVSLYRVRDNGAHAGEVLSSGKEVEVTKGR